MEVKVNVKINKPFRDVEAKIVRAREQALIASAIIVEKDAKLNCPVDTGRLRASITYVINNSRGVATVGTNVEYAKPVEYGTKHWSGKPFLRPALDKNIDKIKRIFANLIGKAGE